MFIIFQRKRMYYFPKHDKKGVSLNVPTHITLKLDENQTTIEYLSYNQNEEDKPRVIIKKSRPQQRLLPFISKPLTNT